MIGATTVSDIDPHHIKTCPISLIGRGQHVGRFRRTFHAMPHDQRRVTGAIGLPSTAREHKASRLDFKQPFLIASRVAWLESARPTVSHKCFQRPPPEKTGWDARLIFE